MHSADNDRRPKRSAIRLRPTEPARDLEQSCLAISLEHISIRAFGHRPCPIFRESVPRVGEHFGVPSVRWLGDGAQQTATLPVAEVQLGDDETDLGIVDDRQRILGGTGRDDGETIVLQYGAKVSARVRIWLDDKDSSPLVSAHGASRSEESWTERALGSRAIAGGMRRREVAQRPHTSIRNIHRRSDSRSGAAIERDHDDVPRAVVSQGDPAILGHYAVHGDHGSAS